MDTLLEKKIADFVYGELSGDCSGHDEQHALRVVANARAILQKEPGDELIVLTAAYLHDCIDHKLYENVAEQKEKVRAFLASCSYMREQIDEVLFIMENISFSSGRSKGLTNRNAQIVCDADRLDALGALGIIRTIEFGASRGRKFYRGIEDVQSALQGRTACISKDSSLAHFYDKLLLLKDQMFTTTACVIAEERTQFMKSFLQEFFKEVGDSNQ